MRQEVKFKLCKGVHMRKKNYPKLMYKIMAPELTITTDGQDLVLEQIKTLAKENPMSEIIRKGAEKVT